LCIHLAIESNRRINVIWRILKYILHRAEDCSFPYSTCIQRPGSWKFFIYSKSLLLHEIGIDIRQFANTNNYFTLNFSLYWLAVWSQLMEYEVARRFLENLCTHAPNTAIRLETHTIGLSYLKAHNLKNERRVRTPCLFLLHILASGPDETWYWRLNWVFQLVECTFSCLSNITH
jgi:hypothetical protein